MEFKKYSEIENTYREDYIAKVKKFEFDKPEIVYACFTKIDGSNFSMILDENDNFLCARRTSILANEEISKFSRCDIVIKNLNMPELMKEVKAYIKQHYANEISFIENNNFILHLYGELCGGMYRHKEVEPVKNAAKIQGRVSYHPDNVWICFDGYVSNSSQNKIFYFDVDQLKDICSNFNIPYQVEKFRGTFDECLKYPNDFNDDTGHLLFGLPLIENNITEGVVIKPIKPIWFPNGERVILKNKNEKFKEKKKVKSNEVNTIEPLNEKEKEVLTRFYECITINRFLSVVSKEQPTSDKEFGKILGLFMKDINDEVLKENKKFNQWIEDKEIDFKRVSKIAQRNVVDFIKPLFFNYLTSILS
jgi:Rnl2 family RNA ligase